MQEDSRTKEDCMKETFTEGPWIAKQEFSNRWRIEQCNDGEFVPLSVGLACTTVLEVGVSDTHTKANAYLIAAAPDLYEALSDAIAFVAAWSGSYAAQHNLMPKLEPRHQEVIDRCMHALAKARGESL